jgi:hypothetical protein
MKLALLLWACWLAAASGYTVQLDPFGDHSIRIRVAPPGQCQFASAASPVSLSSSSF